MANMIDYLKWRGDLVFGQVQFNEVDNLILSYLSYVDMDGIAPGIDHEEKTVEEVSKCFFEKYSKEELEKDCSFVRLAPYVMQEMGKSNRFRKARIKNYVNDIQTEESMQFAAVAVYLDDGTVYIAFRGTDDTIVGWKEDFNLSNGVVPAQKKAVEYLNHVGRECSCPIRVGGHSKGGNLCIYAAAKCDEDIRNQIIHVYCNDGPGFRKEFFEEPGFKEIQHKVQRIVPEFSVIGMLLKHEVEPLVIESSQKGLMQHDGMSWETMGSSFLHKKSIDSKTDLFNKTISDWIEDMKETDRELFINELFSVLEVTGAKTLTELHDFRLKNAKAMLQKLDELDPKAKEIVDELLKTLIIHWKDFI